MRSRRRLSSARRARATWKAMTRVTTMSEGRTATVKWDGPQEMTRLKTGATLGVLKLCRSLDKRRDHRLPREVGWCPGQAAFWDCLPQCSADH